MKEGLVETQKSLKVGPVTDFDTFMSAVIDKKAFDRVKKYIDDAKNGPNTKLIAGGNCDDRYDLAEQDCEVFQTTAQSQRLDFTSSNKSKAKFSCRLRCLHTHPSSFVHSVGYFVEPTIFETSSTKDKIFCEEIFGPVVTAFVYKDADAHKMLSHVIEDTPYALTGAVYAQDQYVSKSRHTLHYYVQRDDTILTSLNRSFANEAAETLKGSAGNFYVNDKSTGSIVGQQPFGGARLSGTSSHR